VLNFRHVQRQPPETEEGMDRRFRHVIEAVLAVDGGALKDSDSPRSIPQWDSVTHLQLLLALESEFGVQFTPEEMAKLSTIGLIRERLNIPAA
jgi:acyl carrier protein